MVSQKENYHKYKKYIYVEIYNKNGETIGN